MSAIESAIENVPGIVGVSAKHFSSGKIIRHNADGIFFTASTLKVPLLVELYRQVDQGKIDLSERVKFDNTLRVPGSGVLKELGEGLQPTLRDLAMLMIIISDNSATDILYNLVGRDNIASMLDELGLTSTRIPMTTRELLYSVVGLETDNAMHTYQMASDKLFLQQFIMNADGFLEQKSDVSSPDDMVRLLELVHNGNVLSPSSREDFFDILKRQQLGTIIPMLLPTGIEAAHKTGGYHTVRCDVGIVHAPNGPYAIAIMAKQVSGQRLEVDLSMSRVSKAVYDEFAT